MYLFNKCLLPGLTLSGTGIGARLTNMPSRGLEVKAGNRGRDTLTIKLRSRGQRA